MMQNGGNPIGGNQTGGNPNYGNPNGGNPNGGKPSGGKPNGDIPSEDDILAERIARGCLEQYSRLSRQGKPGAGQWTVLAGLVLQREDKLEVVSLATGKRKAF